MSIIINKFIQSFILTLNGSLLVDDEIDNRSKYWVFKQRKKTSMYYIYWSVCHVNTAKTIFINIHIFYLVFCVVWLACSWSIWKDKNIRVYDHKIHSTNNW